MFERRPLSVLSAYRPHPDDERLVSMGAEDTARPTWQTQACPRWCTREHREEDHPEDQVHQDDGLFVAAVVAEVDDTTLRRSAEPVEILVQRTQRVDEARWWVLVAQAERGRAPVLLSPESADRLASALVASS